MAFVNPGLGNHPLHPRGGFSMSPLEVMTAPYLQSSAVGQDTMITDDQNSEARQQEFKVMSTQLTPEQASQTRQNLLAKVEEMHKVLSEDSDFKGSLSVNPDVANDASFKRLVESNSFSRRYPKVTIPLATKAVDCCSRNPHTSTPRGVGGVSQQQETTFTQFRDRSWPTWLEESGTWDFRQHHERAVHSLNKLQRLLHITLTSIWQRYGVCNEVRQLLSAAGARHSDYYLYWIPPHGLMAYTPNSSTETFMGNYLEWTNPTRDFAIAMRHEVQAWVELHKDLKALPAVLNSVMGRNQNLLNQVRNSQQTGQRLEAFRANRRQANLLKMGVVPYGAFNGSWDRPVEAGDRDGDKQKHVVDLTEDDQPVEAQPPLNAVQSQQPRSSGLPKQTARVEPDVGSSAGLPAPAASTEPLRAVPNQQPRTPEEWAQAAGKAADSYYKKAVAELVCTGRALTRTMQERLRREADNKAMNEARVAKTFKETYEELVAAAETAAGDGGAPITPNQRENLRARAMKKAQLAVSHRQHASKYLEDLVRDERKRRGDANLPGDIILRLRQQADQMAREAAQTSMAARRIHQQMLAREAEKGITVTKEASGSLWRAAWGQASDMVSNLQTSSQTSPQSGPEKSRKRKAEDDVVAGEGTTAFAVNHSAQRSQKNADAGKHDSSDALTPLSPYRSVTPPKAVTTPDTCTTKGAPGAMGRPRQPSPESPSMRAAIAAQAHRRKHIGLLPSPIPKDPPRPPSLSMTATTTTRPTSAGAGSEAPPAKKTSGIMPGLELTSKTKASGGSTLKRPATDMPEAAEAGRPKAAKPVQDATAPVAARRQAGGDATEGGILPPNARGTEKQPANPAATQAVAKTPSERAGKDSVADKGGSAQPPKPRPAKTQEFLPISTANVSANFFALPEGSAALQGPDQVEEEEEDDQPKEASQPAEAKPQAATEPAAAINPQPQAEAAEAAEAEVRAAAAAAANAQFPLAEEPDNSPSKLGQAPAGGADSAQKAEAAPNSPSTRTRQLAGANLQLAWEQLLRDDAVKDWSWEVAGAAELRARASNERSRRREDRERDEVNGGHAELKAVFERPDDMKRDDDDDGGDNDDYVVDDVFGGDEDNEDIEMAMGEGGSLFNSAFDPDNDLGFEVVAESARNDGFYSMDWRAPTRPQLHHPDSPPAKRQRRDEEPSSSSPSTSRTTSRMPAAPAPAPAPAPATTTSASLSGGQIIEDMAWRARECERLGIVRSAEHFNYLANVVGVSWAYSHSREGEVLVRVPRPPRRPHAS